VASLVVTVDREALRDAPDAAWRVHAPELAGRVRGFLDAESTLFVVVLEGGRPLVLAAIDAPRVIDGVLAGGDVFACEHDIGHVLPRLACRSIDEVAAWRTVPRVLTPGELDVLRYELRVGVSSLPSAPEQLVEDATAQELRRAVWLDPTADASREIYADYLQDHGDPRGELIALQLRRAHDGGAPSARELVLLRGFAADCVQPLTPYLRPGYLLRRGFLTRCGIDDAVAMPEAIIEHPAWATVEAIVTENARLLASPTLRSCRRVSCETIVLAPLAARAEPLPFEVIVGSEVQPRDGRRVYQGLWPYALGRQPEGELHAADSLAAWLGWRGVIDVGALTRLRIVSVRGDYAEVVEDVLHSELGARLAQLDVVTNHDAPALRRWVAAFEAAPVPLLSLRFWRRLPGLRWTISDQLVALEKRAGAIRIIVELEQPPTGEQARALLRVLAQVGRGVRELEIRDLGDPARVVERQGGLARLLAPLFPVIRLRDDPVASLVP
jgi:uncharacterized protein (TIGR02996 family)